MEILELWGEKTPRYAGIIQLLFLIGRASLIGVWFGEYQRANTTDLVIANTIASHLACRILEHWNGDDTQ